MSTPKNNPILDNLSDDLKDPDKFIEIEKHIDQIMHSDHKHETIKSFSKCKRCQDKFNKKRDYIKSLGFKDIEQYQTWKRIIPLMNNILKNDERLQTN